MTLCISQVVMEGHILAIFLEHYGLASVDDVPPSTVMQTLEEAVDKRAAFKEIVSEMLSKHIDLPVLPQSDTTSCSGTDGVLAYAREVLTLSLLWAEFCDAIREGDGTRVLRCWRFLLLVFKATRRKNYCLEALTLLVQCHAHLSPRKREQLLMSRFINTTGKEGTNIPCDLHMEHLNRVVKAALGSEGTNLTPKNILWVSRCAGPLLTPCQQFDSITSVRKPLGKHTMASCKKDLERIVEQIHGHRAFRTIPGRQHSTFPSVRGSVVSTMNKKKFNSWLKHHIKAFSQ